MVEVNKIEKKNPTEKYNKEKYIYRANHRSNQEIQQTKKSISERKTSIQQRNTTKKSRSESKSSIQQRKVDM